MLYQADAESGLKSLDSSSVTLVCTSPPYADIRKSYQGVKPEDYVDWFLPIATQMLRVLKSDGSLILNINDKCDKGERIPYTFELICKMRESGWKLIETYIWVKTKGTPCASSRRGSDYFEFIYHLAKTTKPVWNVDEIRTPYPPSSRKRAQYGIKKNLSNREARLQMGEQPRKQWNLHPKGAWPKNVLYFPLDQGKDHPAAYSIDLPLWAVKAFSNPGDLVVDPFCGRGTTCKAALDLDRKTIGFDLEEAYLQIGREKYGLDYAIL